MKQTLEKLDELIKSINTLNENEQVFILKYLEDLSRNFRYKRRFENEGFLNLLELYTSSRSENIYDFAFFLLERAYNEDNHSFISEITGLLRGNCPVNNQIADLLLKGIEDTSKSNRLRERFFWIYNYDFKRYEIDFFRFRIKDFIKNNWENPELVGQIIDYLHWNFENSEINIEEISDSIKKYLIEKPEAMKQIYSLTRKILGLE